MRKYITSLRFKCFIETSNGILLNGKKVTVPGKKGDMVITFDTEENAQKCMENIIADFFMAGEEQFFRIDKEAGVVDCNTEGVE